MRNVKNIVLKTIFCVLCLSTYGCGNNDSSVSSSASIQEGKKIDVIVIAGQSNAVGCSSYLHFTKEERSYYAAGFENTKIRFMTDEGYNYSRKFVNVVAGQGHEVTKFGPELGMAEYFEDNQIYLDKQVYLIKYAVGGTAIYDRWRSPSSTVFENEIGDLYIKFINYCNESLALLSKQGFNPVVRAICWMQGESDAGTVAKQYQELENNFINDVCDELSIYNNEDRIKFIDAGISDSSAWINYQTINDAKQDNVRLDSENRYYIDTIKERLTYNLEPKDNPDIYHYDSRSMLKLGRLFAQTIIENEII